ncbi:MAG: hypothetical protein B9S34_07060 [Opitutia bacterium Tous-C1TDCM]|nr:MAG: hypothetical protein B9S34_07060 [Opitutae bacterium Tous-C1TDCM]
MFRRLRILCLSLALAAPAAALPMLQLDIAGGTYDTVDQTTVANADVFTLRTLLKANSSNVAVPYFLSVAIAPGLALSNPAPDIGTFKINGVAYTGSMLTWGTPPTNVPDFESGNLSPHGIYPTYYLELQFSFANAGTVSAYNVQTDAAASGVLRYVDFQVDVSALRSAYNLHFDLYNEKFRQGDYSVDRFAPFSHDAASGSGGYEPPLTVRVPDTASVAGLAFGGIALLLVASRRRRN